MDKVSNIKIAVVLTLLSLWLAGCQSEDGDSILLDAEDQAAAEQILYPRFDLAHAAPRELDAELQQRLDDMLEKLSAVPESDGSAEPVFSLVVTAEPDADAGCVAGGRLFVSEGLLAWVQNADELAGALAVAMHQCPRASRLWRQRDGMSLVEFNPESELMNRYIDYRLDANASLFNQAVAAGCGQSDCLSAVTGQLTAAGFEPQALSDLYRRIQQAWPQSAWLERASHQPEPVMGQSADPVWAGLLDDYYARRDGIAELAEVRRQISRGRLHPAYQASLRAMRALGRIYETEMAQAELDLHNLHPYYTERILQRVETQFGAIAHAEYYWGWTHAQLKRRDLARDLLQKSIETLPKVSAHHFLAQEWMLANDHERAISHLNHVLEAGQHHPYAADAEMFLALAQQRLEQSR